MSHSLKLLRSNPNYRWTWFGQVVSEVGDNFNNVAVFALMMQQTHSGLMVSGVMLARALAMLLAGPVAGVVLDRLDRRRIMILSDATRARADRAGLPADHPPALSLAAVHLERAADVRLALLHLRARLHPAGDCHAGRVAHRELADADHAMDLGGRGSSAGRTATAAFGYEVAFVFNALSFLFSALAVSALRADGGFRSRRRAASGVLQPLRDYREGLRYLASVPLLLGIAFIAVGWAAGGGAAQILFALFGEQVFRRGAAGIGTIWGFAGLGLLIGGAIGHVVGPRLGYRGFKRTVALSYVSHGLAYIAFSLSGSYGAALAWIAASRVGMASTSILTNLRLLRHTPDEFRGRVFSTIESLRWAVMIVSFAAAGIASQHVSARAIGVVAGVLGATTGLAWAAADWLGKLPEPQARD